jgi:hypothetical protein
MSRGNTLFESCRRQWREMASRPSIDRKGEIGMPYFVTLELWTATLNKLPEDSDYEIYVVGGVKVFNSTTQHVDENQTKLSSNRISASEGKVLGVS